MWSCARRRRGKKRKRACYVVLNAYIFESHYFLLEKREISWYFNIYLEGDNSVKTLPCLSDLSFFFKSEKEKSSIFHCHAHTQPCFHPEVTSTISYIYGLTTAPVIRSFYSENNHMVLLFDRPWGTSARLTVRCRLSAAQNGMQQDAWMESLNKFVWTHLALCGKNLLVVS